MVVPLGDAWRPGIDAWLLVLRAAGRPSTTLGLRDYQLRRLATAMADVGPWEVTGTLLVAWVASQGWQAETLRSWRSAIRSFYGWAHAAGLVDVDPSNALPAVKPSAPAPRPAPESVYRDALAAADERLRLMLRLAAELGMRRGEVARAHARDLERDLLGWTLRVHGKGDKIRSLPVPAGLAGMIRARGLGHLFPGNDHGHLSPAYVGKLVSRAMPEGWSMHKLRHRFGTVAFSVDRDLLTVQQLMGHASVETTRRYVLVLDDALRRTMAAVAAV